MVPSTSRNCATQAGCTGHAGPVEGLVDIRGVIRNNNADAPNGFPETPGVVRPLRMEWRTFNDDGQRESEVRNEPAHYEDVKISYLPNRPDMDHTEAKARYGRVLVDIDIPE